MTGPLAAEGERLAPDTSAAVIAPWLDAWRRKVERHPFRPQREAMLDRLVALLAGVERSALEALGKEIEWLWLPAGETPSYL